MRSGAFFVYSMSWEPLLLDIIKVLYICLQVKRYVLIRDEKEQEWPNAGTMKSVMLFEKTMGK